ncbi:hypothetical protein OIU78_023096 [Salix suchowensis]|nr:hypothetical protein OIU78_023096 [Salix suchowensis]
METKKSNGSRSYEHDIIGWFEDISENAGQVQTETLRRILELNWGVEYLEKWFGDIDVRDMDSSSLESLYTSFVPLASHADLEPYISRIADGDAAPLLTQKPIKLLSLRHTSCGKWNQNVYRIPMSNELHLANYFNISWDTLSSGTTEGRQKYVPFTDHSARTTLQIFSLAAAYRSRVYPTREGGRILEFIYSSKPIQN